MKIRLPLQIGTSSLWSLARSSAFFPGAIFIAIGAYVIYELRDWDKLGWGVGGLIIVVGGIFIYYAVRHAQLALEERPSDVVLDETMIRIEGGTRDGLEIRWSEIDSSRCEVESAIEERLVLWRAIANIPGMILAAVSEGGADVLFSFTEKTPIKRLYVAKHGEEKRMLFAEGDIDVEQQSLDTLIATIRSSRFQPQNNKDAPKKAESPHAILCGNCGASIAPIAASSTKCAFCNHSVAIPDDVRERVGAAATLKATRKSGMARVERLLASQPSSSRAGIALTLAAIPILLAWPLAGYLAVRSWQPTALGAKHLIELMTFPLLMTLAAFLLARARLTDRFAFHAVVVGFGAREPARPGEPYRCRSCEAPLPDVTGTPVVRCVYCNQESVLGLDLRSDAKSAQTEDQSLGNALAVRSRERWLWTFASVAAIGLFPLAWLAVKPSLKRAPPTAAALEAKAAELAFAPPTKFDRGAPKFRNIGEHATLVEANEAPPFNASNCDLYVAPSGVNRSVCRVRFVCDGQDVYGDAITPRKCSPSDDTPLSFNDRASDSGPKIGLTFNLERKSATVSWLIERGQMDPHATFSFEPDAKAISPPLATAAPTNTIPEGFRTTPTPMPSFAPFDRTATVASKFGASPVSSKTCKLHVMLLGAMSCRATLTCAGKLVYGGPTSTTPCAMINNSGTVVLNDPKPTPQDNDPELMLAATGVLTLADALDDGGSYTVNFTTSE